MNLLSDIITYVRRIVKTPSNTSLTNDLIIDYINRFYIMDVDARMELFDLKTLYRFQTTPGIDQYNMPLYSVQTSPTGSNQMIGSYPVYQGFKPYASVNGISVPFYTQRQDFWNLWPNYLQSLTPAAIADSAVQTYQINLPFFPAIPGHIDMAGIIAANQNPIEDPPLNNTLLVSANAPYNGNSIIPTTSVYSAVFITATASNGETIVLADSGQFLDSNVNYGLMMRPGRAPYGNQSLGTYSTTENTVNYATGVVNVTFPVTLEDGSNINAQCYFYEQGLPRGILFYNNVITIRPPPNIPYLVEMEGYLTPAAFLNTSQALPFAYMAEYIARGAARKILSDTGDIEQFMFYEPLFKEQETLVWKRSQRQFTSTRTQTIFSSTQGQNAVNSIGTGVN